MRATRGPIGGSRGGWLLAAGTGAILVLWLGVLPRIADRPGVARRIDFLRQHQIDPSAMFYTEVEAMAGVQERMAAIHREHGYRFWRPGGEPPPPTD